MSAACQRGRSVQWPAYNGRQRFGVDVPYSPVLLVERSSNTG